MRIEVLSDAHKSRIRKFNCGDSAAHQELNLYIRRFALINAKLGYGKTYLGLAEDDSILGYYTLAASSIPVSDFPEGQGMPQNVASIHLGRLAVSATMQGAGIGTELLADIFLRVLEVSASIAVYAIDLIATDEGAVRFYKKSGFTELNDEDHFFVTLSDIRASIESI